MESVKSPKVPGVKNQITQVIMNLVQNAVQAIETGGDQENGQVKIESKPDKVSVLITITDNNPGITPETRSKLSDPFFTTKEPGKGSG